MKFTNIVDFMNFVDFMILMKVVDRVLFWTNVNVMNLISSLISREIIQEVNAFHEFHVFFFLNFDFLRFLRFWRLCVA